MTGALCLTLVCMAINFYQRFLKLCVLDWFKIWSEELSGWVVICLLFSGMTCVYFLFAENWLNFHSVKFLSKISQLVYVGLIWNLVWRVIRMSCSLCSCPTFVYFLFPENWLNFHSVKFFVKDFSACVHYVCCLSYTIFRCFGFKSSKKSLHVFSIERVYTVPLVNINYDIDTCITCNCNQSNNLC